MGKLILLLPAIIIFCAGCQTQEQGPVEAVVSQKEIFEMKEKCSQNQFVIKANELQDRDIRWSLQFGNTERYLADEASVAYSQVLNTCIAYYHYDVYDYKHKDCDAVSGTFYSMYDLLTDKEIFSGRDYVLSSDARRDCREYFNNSKDTMAEYNQLLIDYQLK